MGEALRSQEHISEQQDFARAVLDTYEQLQQEGKEASLYTVVQELAGEYGVRAEDAVQEVMAHPGFENLSDQERASLNKDTFVTKITGWATSFFTGTTKATSEETVALRQTLERPAAAASEEEEYSEQEAMEEEEEVLVESSSEEQETEEYIESEGSGETEEEHQESEEGDQGIAERAKDTVASMKDAGKDQIGKVVDKVVGNERAWAWQNGLYSGVKYSVQNDVSKAFALGFLKEFGDGAFKRAKEVIPNANFEVRDLDAIAFMEVREFLTLMDAKRADGEFVYRGRKFSVELYEPLYEYFKGMDENLSSARMSVREAIMLHCVTNEEERYAARAIYVIKQMGLQTPAQWNMFRYYVGRWGQNRATFKNAIFAQVVGNNLDDLVKGIDENVIKGIEQGQGFVEARGAIEQKYQKLLSPLERKKAILEAEVQELEGKLQVKESGRHAKLGNVRTAQTALPEDNKTRWQSFREKYLGYREKQLDKLTLTEKGFENALKAKRDELTKVQTKIKKFTTEKTNALDPLKTKLQEFDVNLKKVQKEVKGQKLPASTDEIDKFIKQHNLPKELATNSAEFQKQWSAITEAQAKDAALTEFFRKQPLRGSEELLGKAKHMQEAFEKKWAPEIAKSGVTQRLKAKELDPKVHEEFEKIQMQYNAAQKKFLEERKVIYKKIEEEQRTIKSLELTKDSSKASEIEAARKRILAYGKDLNIRQKELSSFSKEFFANNTATIKTMEAAKKGTIQKAFKGIFWKNGVPFVLGVSVVKQAVDIFKGENTLMQGAKDVATTAASLIPVYGTYQDYRAWISGRDEAGRTLSRGERFFRGLMVPVGAVADVTTVIGVGMWMRGGITAAKLGIRGGVAGLRTVRNWQKARGIQETASAAGSALKATGKATKEVITNIPSTLREIPPNALSALGRVPGKLAMHKGKVVLGGLAVGGIYMGAGLEPVGAGEWEEGTELTESDWREVDELWNEEINFNE